LISGASLEICDREGSGRIVNLKFKMQKVNNLFLPRKKVLKSLNRGKKPLSILHFKRSAKMQNSKPSLI
jgi:hypothetical protein